MVAFTCHRAEPAIPIQEPGRLGRLCAKHALVKVHALFIQVLEFDEALKVEHRDGQILGAKRLLNCIAVAAVMHEVAGLCCPLSQQVVHTNLLEVLRMQPSLLSLRLRESVEELVVK